MREIKLKNIGWIIFVVLLLGFTAYKIARNSFTDHLLGEDPKVAKAIIIKKKIIWVTNLLLLNFHIHILYD